MCASVHSMATQSDRPLAVIDVPERCGNAPRKAAIRDFTIALYNREVAAVLAVLRDDVDWHIIGERTMTGHDEVSQWITQSAQGKELRIATVITHGTDCGVDGVLTHVDGRDVAFCHLLFFTGGAKSAKIRQVRSYLISTTGLNR